PGAVAVGCRSHRLAVRRCHRLALPSGGVAALPSVGVAIGGPVRPRLPGLARPLADPCARPLGRRPAGSTARSRRGCLSLGTTRGGDDEGRGKPEKSGELSGVLVYAQHVRRQDLDGARASTRLPAPVPQTGTPREGGGTGRRTSLRC